LEENHKALKRLPKNESPIRRVVFTIFPKRKEGVDGREMGAQIRYISAQLIRTELNKVAV
jgi:hypothetical protein